MTNPPPELSDLIAEQHRLQQAAHRVRQELALDELTQSVGEPIVVGSAGLGLMVWPDLDVTVVCPDLDLDAVLVIGNRLAATSGVREVRFRNDTGNWNTDPDYPDGLYFGLDYRDTQAERWKVDIWFVSEPDRQPDLRHLHELQPQLTDDAIASILRIKYDWHQRPEYGTTITSIDIYRAVLNDGIRSPAAFDATIRPPSTE